MEITILLLEMGILILLAFSGVYLITRLKILEEKFIPKNFKSKITASSNSEQKGAPAFLEQREEFFRINSFFLKMISEKKSKSNFKRLQKEYVEIGTRLFFFASENTIQKFLEYKHLNSFAENTIHEHKIILLWFAEFSLLLRKDLGLDTDSKLTKNYLNILLTYWDEGGIDEKELNILKNQLEKSVKNYSA